MTEPLTGDQIEAVMLAAVLGRENPIAGSEAEDLYAQVQKEADEAKAAGHIIDVPGF